MTNENTSKILQKNLSILHYILNIHFSKIWDFVKTGSSTVTLTRRVLAQVQIWYLFFCFFKKSHMSTFWLVVCKGSYRVRANSRILNSGDSGTMGARLLVYGLKIYFGLHHVCDQDLVISRSATVSRVQNTAICPRSVYFTL